MLSALLALTLSLDPQPAAGTQDPKLRQLAEEIERGINAGDPKGLDAHLDVVAIATRTVKEIDAPADIRESFLTGVRRSKGPSIGGQLADTVKNGGSFKLLRLHEVSGEPHALYRMLSNSGVNYFDVHLGKDATGAAIATDLYIYMSGENFSDTVRRLYLMVLAEAKAGLVDKLMGKERDFIKNVPKLHRMQQDLQDEKYKEVVATFKELPPSLQHERSFLLMRLRAASNLEEAEYEKSIKDFEEAFPGDASLDLLSIDGHILRKHYDAAIATVDRLDKRVGDPYLEYLRGSIFLTAEDPEKAKARFVACTQAEPSFADAYWTLIGLSLKEKKYKDTAKWLNAVEARAGLAIGNLQEIEEYSGFVKSPEYKKWKKEHDKRAAK